VIVWLSHINKVLEYTGCGKEQGGINDSKGCGSMKLNNQTKSEKEKGQSKSFHIESMLLRLIGIKHKRKGSCGLQVERNYLS